MHPSKTSGNSQESKRAEPSPTLLDNWLEEYLYIIPSGWIPFQAQFPLPLL